MKKLLILLLVCLMAMTLFTACGSSGSDEPAEPVSYDFEELYQSVLDMQENADDLMFFPNDNRDTMNGLYIGLEDIELVQAMLYEPPISGYACEIMLVEVKNADDVSKVEQVFQDRIDSAINGGACDVELGKVWEANAKVQTSGNYVAMVVLPDGYTVPENIFEGK